MQTLPAIETFSRENLQELYNKLAATDKSLENIIENLAIHRFGYAQTVLKPWCLPF
jgi:hypothetical protein